MPRIRQSIICPYCNSVINLPKRSQVYCSLWCRFWGKVEKLGPDDCWEWTAGKNSEGYGNFKYKDRTDKAHRVAWILTYGPITDNLCTLHHCDNPGCCNPSHLFLGTIVDNAIDMVRKFRQSGYEHQKLTVQQVKAIKSELINGSTTYRVLAEKYNVTRATICSINTGMRWSHV